MSWPKLVGTRANQSMRFSEDSESSRVSGGFRCSVLDDASRTVIQVEGRLSGEWVDELRRLWRNLKRQFPEASFAVELVDVAYVDEAGMNFMRFLLESGVEFSGNGPYINAVLSELREYSTKDRRDLRQL